MQSFLQHTGASSGLYGAADAAPRPVGFLPETCPEVASRPAGKSPGAFPRNPFFGVGEKRKRLYSFLHSSGLRNFHKISLGGV